jgi:methyltransferase
MSNTRSARVLTMEGAQAAIRAATAEAGRLGVAVVIVVSDPAGNQIAAARMDGAPMLSLGVAADKAWTVAAFGRPTHWWEESLAADPTLAQLTEGRPLLALAGGVPVVDGNELVGAVGVSGATGDQDRQVAEAAAASAVGGLTAAVMEERIRSYFDACNAADPAAIASFFASDAVHYFPPGMYQGPFVGAKVIAERWVAAVESLGSMWTVDQVIADPASGRAVIEWSHFKTKVGTVLRGDEWYQFDTGTGLITEIRAYYASPQDPDLQRLELGGFDYEGRGYPLEPPFTRE